MKHFLRFFQHLIQLSMPILLLGFNLIGYCQTSDSKSLDVLQARAQLNAIQQRILEPTIAYSELEQMKEMAGNIKSKAQSCVKKAKKDLSQLDDIAAASATINTPANKQAVDALAQEQEKTRSSLSDCNLLVYESQKTINTINHVLEKEEKSISFSKNPAFWDVPNKMSLLSLPHYHLEGFYQLSGLHIFHQSRFIELLSIQLFSGLFFSFLVYHFLKRLFLLHPRLTLCISPLKRYLPILTIIIILYEAMSTKSTNIYPEPLLVSCLRTMRNYFIVLLLIQFNYHLLSYKKRAKKKLVMKNLTKNVKILLTLVIFATLMRTVSPPSMMTPTNIMLYQTLYLIILIGQFLWIYQHDMVLKKIQTYLPVLPIKTIHFAVGLFCSSLLIAAAFGYNSIALFVIENTFKTFFLIFIILEIIYAIAFYTRILNDKHDPLSIRFHHWAGLKTNKNFIEATLLKYLLIMGCLHVFAYIFLSIWELPTYYLRNLFDFFENDIYFFDYQINLIHITKGLIVFCATIILGRILGALIAKKYVGIQQKNTRITIVTLTNYLSFTFAFLIALIVMGVSLKGFTLVASALSVGIGFGLKDIAADLMSGLILLLNKPLRPGDHIEIKDIEGFITKIKLLSTEIKTLSEANLILPNASLLNQSVINHTYKNKLTRVSTHIMLEDPKDVNRAKALMLEVASHHPDVQHQGKIKPTVMVNLRPDNNAMHVILTLWCIIKDVDDRYRINSDINAKVLEAIQQADIPLKL